MQFSEPPSSAKIRILLLIESANLPTPEHLQPRARVLRADQIRPDQMREVAPERDTISSSKAARASSSMASSTRKAADFDVAPGEDLGRENHAGEDLVGDVANPSKSVGGALPPPEDVAPSGCGDSIEILRESLQKGAYEVHVLGSDLAPEILHQLLREENRPEVVILEASRDVSVVAARCYEVKNDSFCALSSLLVVLPPAFLDSPNAPQTIAQLMAAGADDFLRCNAPHFEMAARLSSLAKLARARFALAQAQEKMRNLLQTDDLTRLFSRRFFFQMAHREYERASRYGHDLSCLMIDINYFRRINESMGFACSDALLCHVANVLRDVARDVDLLARFSDQKFVLLLPESDMEMADQIAEQIQREIAQRPFLWQNKALPLSISIGESTRRADALTPKTAAPETAASHDIEYSSEQSDSPNAAMNIAALDLEAEADTDTDTDTDAAPSMQEAIASLLEEADAALFVARRGVRNNLMETPMASPLSP